MTAAMKVKDVCSLERKSSECIKKQRQKKKKKKQRHHFAD